MRKTNATACLRVLGRQFLWFVLAVVIQSAAVIGQSGPPEMTAGVSRTFNRRILEVYDGPIGSSIGIGDPISSVTGEFTESVADMVVPAVGMDFRLERSWRSMATYNGPFGKGWDSPINERVIAQVDPQTGKITGLQFFDGNGRSDFFHRWDLLPNEQPSQQKLPVASLHDSSQIEDPLIAFEAPTSAQLTSPPEYFYAERSTGISEIFELHGNTLVRLVPGKMRVEYQLSLRLDQLDPLLNIPDLNDKIESQWGTPQEVHVVAPLTTVSPSGDDIRPINQNERCFRISKRVDLYGNEHVFHYTTTHPDGIALVTDQLFCITDNKGCDFSITYYDDPQDPYMGGIKTITDAYGRFVRYTYDANANLVKVNRMAGTADKRKTLYTYDTAVGEFSALLTIENPNEAADPSVRKPVVRNRYSGRRIVQQEWGDAAITPSMAGDSGNPGEPCFSLAYTYYPSTASFQIPPENNPEILKVQTLVFTRRDGSVVTYHFTPKGEAAGYSLFENGREYRTSYEWHEGKMVKIVHPSPDPSNPGYAGKIEEYVFNTAADDPRNRGQLLSKTVIPEVSGSVSRGETPLVWTYELYDPKWQEPGRKTSPEGVVHDIVRTVLGPVEAPTGYLITKTATSGSDSVVSYEELDHLGRKIKAVDTLGKAAIAVFQPDTHRVLESKIEVDGVVQTIGTFTYDSYGRMASSTDSAGVLRTFEYNVFDQETCVTAPDGVKTKTVYDSNGQIKRTKICGTDGSKIVMRYTRDILGNVIKKKIDRTGSGDFIITEFEFDENSRLVAEVAPSGLRTEYTWGVRDQLLQASRGANTPNPINSTFTYNHSVSIVNRTNHLGHTWTRLYDKLNRLVESIDPLGNKKIRKLSNTIETEIRWQDSAGVDHRHTKFTHDGLGRMILQEKLAKVSPGGADIGDGWMTMSYGVDDAGNIIQQVDENGGTVTMTRDQLGRITETVDSLGNKTNYTYLADLQKILTITEHHVRSDNPGVIVATRTLTNTYDVHQRLASTTGFSGATTTYEYDAKGRLTKSTDDLGNVTESDLDLLGNVLKRRRFENQNGTLVLLEEVENQYDSFGRLWKTIDGEGRVTTLEYDAFDRVTKKKLHDDSEYTWSYDSMGRIDTYTIPNGSSFTLSYDALDQKTMVVRSPGAGVVGDAAPTVFTYEPFGQILSALDGDSYVTNEYNTLGVLSKSSQVVDGGPSRTFEASFGTISERSAVDYPDFGNGGYRVEYDYDSLNRLTVQRTGFTGSLSQTRALTYEGPGKVIETNFGAGLSKLNVLDDGDFLTSTSYLDGQSNAIFSEERIPDILSREIWRRVELSSGGTPFWSRVTHSSNDGQHRLAEFHKDVTAPAWNVVTAASVPTIFGDDEQFTWSSAGKRMGVSRSNAADDSLTYNSVHDLTSSSIGGTAKTYQVNAHGSRASETSSGVAITYQYDIEDHLARIVFENGDSIDYAYDAAGRRIQEIRVVGATTTVHRFYHDGLTKAVEVEVTDGPQGVLENPIAWNVYAEVAGSPVLSHMRDSQAFFDDLYPITDSRGSVVALLDEQGGVVQHNRFEDEFGRYTSHAGTSSVVTDLQALPVVFHHAWKGLRTEFTPSSSNSLLIESGARTYDALAGSYLQRSGWMPEGGQSDSPNASSDFLSGRFSYPGAAPESPFVPGPYQGSKGPLYADWPNFSGHNPFYTGGGGGGPGPGPGPPKPKPGIGSSGSSGNRGYGGSPPGSPAGSGGSGNGGGTAGGGGVHPGSFGGSANRPKTTTGSNAGGFISDYATYEEALAALSKIAWAQFESSSNRDRVAFEVPHITSEGYLQVNIYYFKDISKANRSEGEIANLVLNAVQTGLEVVGMAPGVGDVADVANAVISFARTLADGKGVSEATKDALTTLAIGAVPVAAAGAFKLLAKGAGRAKDTVRLVDKGSDSTYAGLPVGRRGKDPTVVNGNQDDLIGSEQGVLGFPTPADGPPRNAGGVVNGREFSGHAFDRMQERGLTPSVVENTIQHGSVVSTDSSGTSKIYEKTNRTTAIVNSAGKVISAW